MANPKTIIDTGPLVAFINRRDKQHEWIKLQLSNISPPLLTCEAVLAEACFLLQELHGGAAALLECVNRNLIEVSFTLNNEITAIIKMMSQYNDVPMSFADACLVRMAEHYSDSKILTLDSDFKIYRKHGRQVIPTLMPNNI